MNTFPFDHHGLLLRCVAVDAGYTDAQLARAVGHGELVHVTRGAFARPAERTADELHRLAALAVGLLSHSAVLSHQSAALLHGLEVLRPQLRRVHLTVAAGSRGRRTATRHHHESPLSANETTRVDGVMVTSLERTAVDVAALRRWVSPERWRSSIPHSAAAPTAM